MQIHDYSVSQSSKAPKMPGENVVSRARLLTLVCLLWQQVLLLINMNTTCLVCSRFLSTVTKSKGGPLPKLFGNVLLCNVTKSLKTALVNRTCVVNNSNNHGIG